MANDGLVYWHIYAPLSLNDLAYQECDTKALQMD